MGLISLIISPYIALLIPLYIVLYYLLPYLTTYSSLSKYPGPFTAKFSNIWLGLSARSGQKYAAVDWAHRKYGKVVRVGFNHVSIADERALQTVYGHGNGYLKDHFYEAFVVGTTGLFNTRDRADHTRKRKIIAHAFSPKSVSEFEPHMTSNLSRWVQELDKISNSNFSSVNQIHTSHSRQFAKFNAMPWFSYLAFDIIGDLAFGSPFGMVTKGRDETEVQLTPGGPISYAPAVEVLNRRGEVSSTLGLLPFLRPYAQYLPDPFFTKGISAVKNLNGIAVAAVRSRIDAAEKGEVVGNEDRNDILARLLQSKDSKGEKMGRAEVTAEALTQLIAGSDTVSNTSCAIFYYILHGERAAPGSVIPRLQEELDAAIPAHIEVASYSMVRNLPFLKRCIDEGMRLHSTSAIGLPRIVAPGPGVDFDTYGNGEEIVHFPPGTVLSVPSYTIHHLAEIWGPDVEEFKPDRWLCLNERQKTAFNPFSYGPRACVGQNVAIMELQLIIGTVFRRYDFELYQPVLESHEGFSKKPKECFAGIRRRGV